ncbi:unnamed protein product [Ambrosiozyma monospora]|uniref:Unnamed protein product n=1 Tax=Ambrosiozyma monospora TaxID=43982 RepID=A0ACB5TXS6_AMBMO|nr:unnamed protein product [Ambrosiozyma monospora]
MNQANNKSFNSAISDSQDWGSIDDSEINEVLQQRQEHAHIGHGQSQLSPSHRQMVDGGQDQVDGDEEKKNGEEEDGDGGDGGVRIDVKSSQVDSMGTDDDDEIGTTSSLGYRMAEKKMSFGEKKVCLFC